MSFCRNGRFLSLRKAGKLLNSYAKFPTGISLASPRSCKCLRPDPGPTSGQAVRGFTFRPPARPTVTPQVRPPARLQYRQSFPRIHFFFSITMADNHYDNYLEDFTLSIGKVQLKGFVSKQGIANFLNIPYARVPVRFRTAVPILISAHNRGLDVSGYGPRCPQKADGFQASIAHVFEKTSLSQAPDETNCLHLNIYTPHAATCLSDTSSLPVFVWIHGGAFNIGDNSTQFGMFCICAKQTYR